MPRISETGAQPARVLGLLARLYGARRRGFDLCSGRDGGWRAKKYENLKKNPFHVLLTKCLSAGVLPQVVIELDFLALQLGQPAPLPSQLLRDNRLKKYRELQDYCRHRSDSVVTVRLGSAERVIDRLEEALGCGRLGAVQRASRSGEVPAAYSYALLKSYDRATPQGLADEALYQYCLTPDAHRKAMRRLDLKTPPLFRRYHHDLTWLDRACAKGA